MSLGDFDTGTVVYSKFTLYRPSTGAPYTLGGTPALSVYKDNSTTQSTAGVTLTADFDSITGLNHFAVDTSADGTFYAAGSFFDIVITTGTVDSVSAVGTVVGRFTLRKNSALKPTTAGRTLDVSAGGEAGVDWANVGSPTTTLALTGTTIATTQKVDVETIKTNPVVNAGTVTFPTTATLASTTNITAGTVTTATNVTTVNGLASGVITATSIASDAITAAKIADGAIDAATFAAGAITATVIAADAIGASELAADAVAEIADAVWDEVLSGHLTGGSTGNALNAAGSAGDPWSTALPGAYSAGSAGYIIGTNLDATVGTRATQTSVNTIDDFLDTEIAAIKTVTDQMAFGTANRLNVQVYGMEAGVVTAAAVATGAIDADALATDAAAEIATAVLTTQMTESYRATNAAPTLAQAAFELIAHMGESAISSTTKTLKKLDGSTTAKTYTLNDASTPTSITETT